MKRFIIAASLAVAVMWSLMMFVGVAGGQSLRSGDNLTIPAGETIDSSLFASGRTIDIAGTVEGDVYCAGQNIVISGSVNGDVLCAGQNIRISGTVDGSIRAAGQSVSIGGSTAGAVSVAAQSIVLEGEATVGRDMFAAGNDIHINGRITRDLGGSATTAVLSGEVGRNVKANIANKLQLTSTAQVQGDMEYSSRNEATIAGGAAVQGEVRRTEPTEQARSFSSPLRVTLGWIVYMIVALLIIALVLVLLFPTIFQAATDRALASPLRALLFGVIASFAVPVLFFALLITVVGIPLAFFLLFLWIVVLFLGGPFLAYYIGRLVLRNYQNPIPIMLVGGAILFVAYFIPIVGVIAVLAAVWFGTGIFLNEAMRRVPRPTHSIRGKAVR